MADYPRIINPGWILNSPNGIDSLTFHDDIPLPEIHEEEVLVRIHAASLNSRDLMIVQGGSDLTSSKPNLIPGSDGAGIVERVGSKTTFFRPGDRVCTHLTYCPTHNDDEPPVFADIRAGLGQKVDGTLRVYGVFHQTCLVHMPSHLDFVPAATLTCSGLTAWNALFGLPGKGPEKGKTVLIQGTGGVSIAALQFSLAAGAKVIATTSSNEKAQALKSLGATQVINYRETSNWGEAVKNLSSDGKGVDLVVDVGGASTLQQSLQAVRPDGVIASTGILGDPTDATTNIPTILDCLFASCTARGFFLGSRKQFQEMNAFIEKHRIEPIVDPKVFGLKEIKEAYVFLKEQRHFSKVAIRIE